MPVGRVVQIRGREIHPRPRPDHRRSLGLVTGRSSSPWMDSLMQFVQVDPDGRPEPLDEEPERRASRWTALGRLLRERARKLLHIR